MANKECDNMTPNTCTGDPKASAGELHETMFLIVGVLTELHVDYSPEGLIEKITHKLAPPTRAAKRSKPVADSAIKQFAGAVRAATYEHENLQNFACLIGDQVVCGQFGGAEKLRNGDEIRAVVSRRGEVWLAHALLNRRSAMIWSQHTTGSLAQRVDNVKFYIRSTVLVIGGLAVFEHMAGPIFGAYPEGLFLCAGIALAYAVLYGAWDDYTTRQAAKPATTLFRLLGFDDPEKVRLRAYSYYGEHFHEIVNQNQTVQQHGDIYCLQKGLAEGVLRYDCEV